MTTRKYREVGVHNAAAEIASEVILRGRSVGWAGSLENLERVGEILRPFNIVYVCDMLGEWGPA